MGEIVHEATSAQMSQMIRGYWVSQIVGTMAALGIADHISEHTLTHDEIAKSIECDPKATYRLLRAAATIGVISVRPGGQFALTPLGQTLRSNVAGSMRDTAVALTAPGHWLPWGRLVDAIRSGERQACPTLGRELFQYYADSPAENRAFAGAMSYGSAVVANEVAAALDASKAELVVDVGGGAGTIMAAILDQNPHLRGTIVELASVVPAARAVLHERGLSSRCEVVEGDFFEAVPESDIFVLKRVIHDWDDEQSVRILSNCARALRKDGRVVLLERVLPEQGVPSAVTLQDLNMLVLLPGCERTVEQFGDLLRAAGLQLDRITATDSSLQVIEASALGS